VNVVDSFGLVALQCALGSQLAVFRTAAEANQNWLGRKTGFSRSAT